MARDPYEVFRKAAEKAEERFSIAIDGADGVQLHDVHEGDSEADGATPGDAGAVRTWTAIDLYRAKEIRKPEGLLAGHVFCPQSVALVVGPGGAGKSHLAFFLGRHVADGRAFGRMATRQADVLYLSEEMTEGELRARLQEIFTEAELEALGPRLKIRCRSGIRIDNDAGIAALRKLIEAEGSPRFVIIDSLTDVHALDENKNSQMAPALKAVRDKVATPTGACIVFIHHAGKPTEFLKGADRSRGASAMRDITADVLTVDRGKDGTAVVKFAKVRHGAEPPAFSFSFAIDDATGLTTLEIGDPTPLGETEFAATKQLLGLIRESGGCAVPVDLKDAAIKNFGWSKATYYRHQKAALASGFMVKDDTVSPSVLRAAK